MKFIKLTAVIEREGNGYVALCPAVDIASQGETVEEARTRLRETLEGYFMNASAEEIQSRLHEEQIIESVEVKLS